MSLNDLDLTKVSSDNPDEAASKIEEYYKRDSSTKSILSYHWEKNHMMLDGQQWITYDGDGVPGSGQWRQISVSDKNHYIPRPVTNYIFDSYQTLKSYLLKNQPRITVRPNTETERDKTAARIAELVAETNWKRLQEDYNYEAAAGALITYGTVFKKDIWDTSFGGTAQVPIIGKKPVLDENGQPTGDDEYNQEVDEDGQPKFEYVNIGDVNTVVVEPYRMSLDPLAITLHTARWVMESSIQPLTWIHENFDQEGNGYTGRAKEVKAEKSLSGPLRRFFNLRNSVGTKRSDSGFSAKDGHGQMLQNSAVVKEYYERPTAKYPKGRLFVVANGVPLYAGDSPYDGPELGDWHPYSECRWEVVPGRFWGKSPFDDATEMQRTINSIDSAISLTRKTQALPQKLVPHGSIPLGTWTGMPGQQVQWKPGPNGEKPEILPASGVHDQVWREREQKVQDLKNITGAVDILKGDRPPGVTAASALELLFEVATGKLSPILKRWKVFIESSQKKQLQLIAKKYKEPRPEFIKRLVRENRELTPESIQAFVGDDLHDNCNVIIEASSSISKLKAVEQAKLLQLAQLNVLGLDDPGNRQEFLERFGVQGFTSDYSLDAKRAERENDAFVDLADTPDQNKVPMVLDIDNHQIHIAHHEAFMKTQKFMSLPTPVQQMIMEHDNDHKEKIAQAQQEQMMQQMMSQMPPGAGPSPEPQGAAPQGGKSHVGPGAPPQYNQASMVDVKGPASTVGKIGV